MKTLKILSIAGLVWYPVWFFVGLLYPSADVQNISTGVGLAIAAFLLYFVFHAVMAFLQGNKTKKNVLKIASIICFVIIGLSVFFSIMVANGLDIGANGFEKLDLTRTSISSAMAGVLLIDLPFAIAFAIITLIVSSKEIKKSIKTGNV